MCVCVCGCVYEGMGSLSGHAGCGHGYELDPEVRMVYTCVEKLNVCKAWRESRSLQSGAGECGEERGRAVRGGRKRREGHGVISFGAEKGERYVGIGRASVVVKCEGFTCGGEAQTTLVCGCRRGGCARGAYYGGKEKGVCMGRAMTVY